jgi:hypothetical protein
MVLVTLPALSHTCCVLQVEAVSESVDQVLQGRHVDVMKVVGAGRSTAVGV